VNEVGEETKGITEPISPELVLIDAELAATARALLPDYSVEYARPALRPVGLTQGVSELVGAPEQPTEPLTWAEDREVQLDQWERKAPSWRIRGIVTVMVAALFALSVVAVLSWRRSADEPRAAVPHGASIGTGPDVPRIPETTTLTGGTTIPEEPLPVTSERTERTAPAPTATGERPAPPSLPPPLPPPVPYGDPPSNVLGVVVTTGSRRVTLRWQRPAGAVDVIILRRPGRHGAESIVYKGKRNTYVDRNVRDRVAYRYLIISRDSQGRVSSGVPTIVRPRGRS
jgi:hypothetical protein